MLRVSVIVLASSLVTSLAYADTLEVGPGKTYEKACDAFDKAKDGDTIQIDAAGDYKADLCIIAKNKLTIRGVNGLAKIDANGTSFGDKSAWVVAGDDTTIENIEFVNAKSTSKNGAGIRQEGKNLTIRHCSFHDNENGILAGDKADSTITIENTEFAKNGFGDGQSHNLYINHVAALVFRFNYSHDAKIGHLLKSRAKTNLVAYNRLTDEGGTASYEIDLPNAGTSYVIGNVIEQSSKTDNPAIVAYGEEGVTAGWGTDLYVVNNTIINHRENGGTFVFVGDAVTTKAQLTNNIFFGKGSVTTQAGAVQTTNYAETDPNFVDAAKFDFHLVAGSPCVDKGTLPAAAALPEFHYVHPTSNIGRQVAGSAIDIGAYELNGDVAAPGGSDAGASSSSGDASGSSSSGSATSSSGSTTADGGATPTGSDSSDDGCGCRTAPTRSNTALVSAGILGVALVLRRRARRARRR